MTDDERTAALLVICFAAAVALLIVLVMSFLARTRCPACGKPTLELDMQDNPGGIEPETGAKKFRCQGCLAEFRRLDKGPLIPRGPWEAGAREAPPIAKVVRR